MTDTDPTRLDPTRLDPTRLDPTGLDPTGLDPTGLDPTGLDPTRLDPTGLDPTRLDPTGLDTTGLDPSDFDPRLERVQQCPFPHYAALRESAPVHEMPGEWVGRGSERVFAVSRFDLVTQVLTDWHTFSSKFGSSQAIPPDDVMRRVREIMSKGWPRPATMLTADPPVHTRFRRLVSKAFTPKRVQDLAPDILRICEGLVDSFAPDDSRGGEIDLIPSFCVPIPTSTVALALGVPEERFADFKRWADASVAPIGRQLDMDGWIGFAEGVVELQQYFAAEFEHRMDHPKDDLLTALLNARLASSRSDVPPPCVPSEPFTPLKSKRSTAMPAAASDRNIASTTGL